MKELLIIAVGSALVNNVVLSQFLGICCGILTGVFRLFGGSAEGVSYAIIISNLLVPLIERVTLPKPFGKGGEK